jgi:predicted phosphohydrolase
LAIGGCYYLYWDNYTLGVTNYTVENAKIPSAFDGYKIVLLADIQGSEFDEKNQMMIDKIEQQQADMVVFAGDLIDMGVPGSIETIENLFKH